MGQIVKQMSSHTTRYYWYPGEKKEWLRGVVALAAGAGVYLALHLLTHGTLLAAVVGTSVDRRLWPGSTSAAATPANSRASPNWPRPSRVRRQTAVHTGRAVWRGIAEGTGGAAAAVHHREPAAARRRWRTGCCRSCRRSSARSRTRSAGCTSSSARAESTDGPAKRAAAAVAPAGSAPASWPRVWPASGGGRGGVRDSTATPASAGRANDGERSYGPAHAQRSRSSAPARSRRTPAVTPRRRTAVSARAHGRWCSRRTCPQCGRAKPLMPLSAAIAARKDVADVAGGSGHALTDWRPAPARDA